MPYDRVTTCYASCRSLSVFRYCTVAAVGIFARVIASITVLHVVLIIASLPTCAGAYDDRPIVVFREDDIRSTWRVPFVALGGLTALEYGKLKRIPITWGIITDAAFNGWGITWAELEDYLSTAGGEAASHSCSHMAMPSYEAYIAEITNSRRIIEQNLPGRYCTTFLQPGNWTGSAYLDQFAELRNPIGQAIQSTYTQSMAYLGNGWSIGNTHYLYGMTNQWSLDYHAQPTTASLNATLDVIAETPGLVFVFSSHGVQEAGNTLSYHVQADLLKAFMDRLADLRDRDKIRLMSLHDACRTTFSPGLNGIPDPGFEHCKPGPLNPVGPWRLYGNASIASSGGLNDSRYVSTGVPYSEVQSAPILVAPGRYELTWWQQSESGYPFPRPLLVYVRNYSTTEQWHPVLGPPLSNSSPGTWEMKKVLLLVRSDLPSIQIYASPTSGVSYGIDDVSLVPAPVDPAVSPSQSSAYPLPGQVRVGWNTPPSPDVVSIVIRIGNRTHPLTPADGTALAQVEAQPGTRQETAVPIDWPKQTPGVYISVFAVKPNQEFSAPDLVVVPVNTTTPPAPELTLSVLPSNTVTAQWSSPSSQTGISGYEYAVGRSPGASDTVGWTRTTDTSTTLGNLPAGQELFFSVKTQSIFGLWSPVSAKPFLFPSGMSYAVSSPDGTLVTVSGTVSAVFGDCFYLQLPSRARAIRVASNLQCREGDELEVTGRIITVGGQRTIAVEQ